MLPTRAERKGHPMTKKQAKKIAKIRTELDVFAVGLLYEQSKAARKEWEAMALDKLGELGVALGETYPSVRAK